MKNFSQNTSYKEILKGDYPPETAPEWGNTNWHKQTLEEAANADRADATAAIREVNAAYEQQKREKAQLEAIEQKQNERIAEQRLADLGIFEDY